MLKIRAVTRIAEIPAGAWDNCAGPENPFVSHAFLDALEASGSATAETGWLPQHLVLEDEAGVPLGAVPLYLKSHSWGEYVFDQSWAQAYERAGGRYYPKLQCAVPFTPAAGPRLLLAPGAGGEAGDVLTGAMLDLARRRRVSSLHVTFPTQAEWARLGEAGFLLRQGLQYQWENPGYGDFEDFLSSLSARKRKAIRRERRDALASGLTVHTLTGKDIEEAHWDAFFDFYRSTSDRKWGLPYLTRDFFTRIGRSMADRIVLIMAEDGERWVAGALNLLGADVLYGRNWGCIGDYPFLHFELCYYRAIDFAIANGLKRVEAGAQGEHKIQRGYLPSPTYSAHWLRDPGFREAVSRFLDEERLALRQEADFLAELSPFRRREA